MLLASCSDQATAAEEPERAVVHLRAESCTDRGRSTATGVAVGETIIATVAHTFQDASSVRAIDVDETERPAEIIWLDEERDFALLRVEAPMPLWLPLGDAEDGEEVTVITARSNEPVQTRPASVVKHLTATFGGVGERATIELDAEIARGDSGAPVVNAEGQVIGVVFAVTRGESQAWVIAAKEIEAALAQPKGDLVSLNC